VEPRATPAATRGQEPCPCITTATTKTDSKTDTEQKSGNVPEYRKHLKSLVLGAWVVLGLIYLAYLYARHPQRIAETRRVFISEEQSPVGAGPGRSGGTPETTS